MFGSSVMASLVTTCPMVAQSGRMHVMDCCHAFRFGGTYKERNARIRSELVPLTKQCIRSLHRRRSTTMKISPIDSLISEEKPDEVLTEILTV